MSHWRISNGLFIAAALAACSGAHQRAFNSPVLEPLPPWQATPDAMRVSIEPITRENLPDFSDLGHAVLWQEPDPKSQHSAGGVPPARVTWVERIGTLPIVPLPGFRLSVENGSKQPLSFGSRIELVDNLQRQYRPILDSAALKSRLIRDLFGTSGYLAQQPRVMRAMSDEIDDLTILTPSLRIGPGAKWVGYLFFETGALGADDYNDWMSTVSSFTLRLKSSSEAGPEFVFELQKRNRAVTLTCPSDVKLPSLERCKRLEP